MDREGNEETVWTHLEAATKFEARRIVEQKWGEGWRAVEIKPGIKFIHFSDKEEDKKAQ